jgi:hypothetical protein
MIKQSTATIVMVPPDHFRYNLQTAKTNPFQHSPKNIHKQTQEIRNSALNEFNEMVKKLRKNGVTVHILPSRSDVTTPDAVFPNNWFSHHIEDKLVIYPIQTDNRRQERQKDALLSIIAKAGLKKPTIIDISIDEEKELFLESTGSMIFDRVHNVTFAMASPRTIKETFEKWCSLMNYEGVFIQSTTQHAKAVYHTNINMSIGSDFAVVCFDVIKNKKEQKMVKEKLESLGKEVISISLDQVYQFCGNILELSTKSGKKIIAMSDTARKGFTKKQIAIMEKYCTIVSFSIPTIEKIGGGGVRCMIAEIFPETTL